MAKGWRSTTNIQFGREDGTVVMFGPGDVVEGLTKVQMAELWDAGALEEAEVTDSKPPANSETARSPEGGSTEGEPGA